MVQTTRAHTGCLFPHAMAIAACITPTDPVLSSITWELFHGRYYSKGMKVAWRGTNYVGLKYTGHDLDRGCKTHADRRVACIRVDTDLESSETATSAMTPSDLGLFDNTVLGVSIGVDLGLGELPSRYLVRKKNIDLLKCAPL